jgi:hypothetical protein
VSFAVKPSSLRPEPVLARLRDHHEEQSRRVDLRPGSPHHGAWISPEMSLPEAGHVGTTLHLARAALLCAAARRRLVALDEPRLLREARAHLAWLLRAQRPSGLIDLRSCNYDSGPDTAFAVQLVCAVVELARGVTRPSPAWRAVLRDAERFLRRAFPGLLGGGFHTPNHRWVVASALAWSAALLPALRPGRVLADYLAEGVDIDDEGSFIERSAAIYDAVCDRSLLLLHEHAGWVPGLDAALRNLRFNLSLLHPDGSIDTSLSHRQDHGLRAVPLNLAPCYLHAAARSPRDRAAFLSAAALLVSASGPTEDKHLFWLAHALFRLGPQRLPASTALPSRFRRWFPQKPLWRVRQDDLSASFLGRGTTLATLRCRDATLHSLKITQSYFGTGRFIADRMRPRGKGLRMECEARHFPHAPGYQLPLGRPVPMEDWAKTLDERPMRAMPPCRSRLDITPLADGFAFDYRTLDGIDGVPAQIALDFAPGAIWESAGTSLVPAAGQTLFLTSGLGRLIYPDCVVEISPGADAHRTWRMRDAEPVGPDSVRILIPLLTPLRHRFRLRFLRSRSPR